MANPGMSPPPDPPLQFVEVAPFRFAYREQGDPAHPPLVLLHGLSENSAFFWRPLIADFQDDYRILAFDLLGHGASSSRPRWGYRTEKQADLLARALRQIEPRPAVIVGHSLGGMLAARLAIDHPDRVSRLVLYDTPLPQGPARNLFYALRTLPLHTVLPLSPLLLPDAGNLVGSQSLFRRIMRFVLMQWRVPLRDEQREGEFLDYSLDNDRVGLGYSLRDGFFMHDLSGDLPRLNVPTCLIVGEHDTLVRLDDMRALARSHPRMQLRVIADAGHVALIDQPQRFNRVLRAFLSRK